MPELPEVETTVRGIKPHIENVEIVSMQIRHHKLRWDIESKLPSILKNKKIDCITRRGKYLLMQVETGTLILHLGMSGSLRITNTDTPTNKHDHVDIIFKNNKVLRYTDPRRFGAILWTENLVSLHPLIQHLGPEPLTNEFSAEYLWQQVKNKTAAIKTMIMDNKIVVGVGNIYATEALFLSGIHPLMPGKRMAKKNCEFLSKSIKEVLAQAIQQGGTTLKDFVNSEGKPGYFSNQLKVYGRDGLPCFQCKNELKLVRLSGRATVYCAHCQQQY